MSARVARLCLPGPMWYVAVCRDCAWAGLDWKHREWAVSERDSHNERKHRQYLLASPPEYDQEKK